MIEEELEEEKRQLIKDDEESPDSGSASKKDANKPPPLIAIEEDDSLITSKSGSSINEGNLTQRGDSFSSKVEKQKKKEEHNQKLRCRLELEFEDINEELREVHDIEEIRNKELKIKRTFSSKLDQGLTTAHIKPARKILGFFRQRKEQQLSQKKENKTQ